MRLMMNQARHQSDVQHAQGSIAARKHGLMTVLKSFVAGIVMEALIQPVFTAYAWTSFARVTCSDHL